MAWRQWLHHPPDRLGWRGAVMFLVGVLWVLFAAGILVDHDTYRPGSALWHEQIPLPVRVLLWGGTGAVAIYCSWRRPRRYDKVGWAALILMPAERALSCATSYAVYLVTGPLDAAGWWRQQGLPYIWPWVLAWSTITLLIYTLAGALALHSGEESRQ